MNAKQPKKMIIINILDILRKYTDEDHRLSQKEIGVILKNKYDMNADRKAIHRNLMELRDFGYNIECTESIKMIPVKDPKTGKHMIDPETGETVKEESIISTDFYLSRNFTKSELQALIYNMIFTKHISHVHKQQLINKLVELGPISLRCDLNHFIRKDSESAKEFSGLFMTLEDLEKAIDMKKLVHFQYSYYDAEKKRYVDDRIWKVFPMGIAEKNNDFYLVGVICGSERMSVEEFMRDIKNLIKDAELSSRCLYSFRIDQIANLVITDNEELTEKERELAKKISFKTINKDW